MILLSLILTQIATSVQGEPKYVVVEGVELETVEHCDQQVCTGQALTPVVTAQSSPHLAYQVGYERGRVASPWSSTDLVFRFAFTSCQNPDSVRLFMGDPAGEVTLWGRSDTYSTTFFPDIYAPDSQAIVFRIEGNGPSCSGRGEISAKYVASLKTWANTLEQRQPLNRESIQ